MNKNDVREGLEILFADGLKRTVRPLTIKKLRKFVKVTADMANFDDNTAEITDDQFNTMMDAAAIVIESVDPELAADRDKLEDAVDLKIFGQLMSIAMGASSPEV